MALGLNGRAPGGILAGFGGENHQDFILFSSAVSCCVSVRACAGEQHRRSSILALSHEGILLWKPWLVGGQASATQSPLTRLQALRSHI